MIKALLKGEKSRAGVHDLPSDPANVPKTAASAASRGTAQSECRADHVPHTRTDAKKRL